MKRLAIPLLFVALLAACAGPTGAPAAAPAPVIAPTPFPTAAPAPPALPEPFVSSRLNPLDRPHAYIADDCARLRMKWDPAGAAPGTVVMVIMIHGIADFPTGHANMSAGEFHALMSDLKTQGFAAITTAQLAGFLERNAYIPARSVLLIQDDRHYRQNFDEYFYPYWIADGWPVINAWISAAGTSEELWQENADLEREGWVDHQAHGVVHNLPITSDASDEYIQGELLGSIDAFRERFDKTPIAFIWPGGGFTPRAVGLARQAGYRLGFTTNPRGPVMFDWVPLADEWDPLRRTWIPEGPAGDPLLTLPRYWSTDARSHIDEVRLIGKEAAAYAESNRAVELEYYQIVCAPDYGPLPGAAP